MTTSKSRSKKQQRADALRDSVDDPVDLRAHINDPSQVGRVPGPDVCCVLDLAKAIHRAESDHCAISWSAQERAQAFYNDHGMYDALTEMHRLQKIEVEGACA